MPKLPDPDSFDPFADDFPDNAPDAPSDEVPEASAEERLPFLKPHHLKQPQGVIKLLEFTGEASEYSDAILRVQADGKQYRLGMKLFSPEYKALRKRFGPKKSNWKGDLRYKVMPHKGNPRGFVAVR